MRRIVALLVVLSGSVLGFLGCGDEPAAPAAGDAARGGIELPVVGLLGALPPKEGRVTIGVDARGGLRVDGKTCAWADLAARLREATSRPLVGETKSGRTILTATMSETVEENLEEVEDTVEETVEESDDATEEGQEIVAEEPVIENGELNEGGTQLAAPSRRPGPRDPTALGPHGTSNMDVLLRIDRRVPWSVAGQVLMACARPDLKLRRTFHAVMGADDLGEGALAVFLPMGIGCGRADDAPPIKRVKMIWREGPGEARPGVLATALRRRLAMPTTSLEVHLVARPATSYGQVLLAVDAALRAGAVGIGLKGFAMPRKSPAELCAEPPEQGAHHWAISGQPLMSKPAKLAAGPGRSEGYEGIVNDLGHGEPEIEESGTAAGGK